MGFQLIGGGGTGTPTPTPTQATRIYDTTGNHFGLSAPAAAIAGGATNNSLGTMVSLGTLTAAIDGLDVALYIPSNQAGAYLRIEDGAGNPLILWPVNPVTTQFMSHSIPIRVAAGTELKVGWAVLTAGATANVRVEPFQSSVTETITSWSILGSTAGNLSAQGTAFTAVTDLNQWKAIGTLGAGGAKALAVTAFLGTDTTRTGGNYHIIDVGTGATDSEAVLLPAISPRAKDSTNAVPHHGSGARRVSIAGSTQLSARVQTESGTLPDGINIQIAVGA